MNIIYVNEDKKLRAQNILLLVAGKSVPRTQGDVDNREKFTALLSEAEIDSKSDDALPFIYEKLGGLIRTPAEQKAADKKKEEMQRKAKKRMIE